MFGWFRRKSKAHAPDEGAVATSAPMEPFAWPKGVVITAVDEVVLALPMAVLEKDRPMSEFVFGPDGMEIGLPPEGDAFFIRLAPGMSVSLAKSCQCYVVAEDKNVRRLKVKRPEAET